jgi:hypothetical protein
MLGLFLCHISDTDLPMSSSISLSLLNHSISQEINPNNYSFVCLSIKKNILQELIYASKMPAKSTGQGQSRVSRRTLPETLDEIARETPNRRYATTPVSPDVNQGFRDVSFEEMINGVNRFAFLLEKLYGRSDNFETLTYLGIPDLRYVMVIFGAIKCGYKVYLPSKTSGKV